MEPSDNNHINIVPEIKQKVIVRASEIIKKFKSFKDRESFCIENSKLFLLLFRPLFP